MNNSLPTRVNLFNRGWCKIRCAQSVRTRRRQSNIFYEAVSRQEMCGVVGLKSCKSAN